jgi:endonuclease YncB( thermonuclease family)
VVRLFDYRARAIRVLDGDTVVILVDVGFFSRVQVEIRLADVHAPEHDEPGGFEAKARLQFWLDALPQRTWPLYVQTQKTSTEEPTERRSFTRYVGTVAVLGDSSRSLNKYMIDYLAEHPEWGPGKLPVERPQP